MKISYLSGNFREWFGTEFPEPKEIKLEFRILEKSMNDQKILDELKPEAITLNELAYVLENELLDKDDVYICYIKDKNNNLRAVSVYWDGDGWLVDAFSVGYPFRWSAGCRVFSSNFLTLKTLDTLENKPELGLLERVRILEEWKEKIDKIININ